MEFATRPLSDRSNMVVIVPVMDKSIKLMQPIKPLDSRLQPELVGVWNSKLPIPIGNRQNIFFPERIFSMALTHAQSTELIDIRPFGCNLGRELTRTLVKTDTLEIVRLVMRAGKVYEGHKVPGEITVQCLEGRCT